MTNPIIPGFHPDPSICRVEDDFYLVTSSFEFFPGVPIFHSKDLEHWEQIGHVLIRDSQLDLTGVKASEGIYAPTIRYHNGTFYVITTLMPCCRNFIVHAESPYGPWSDPVYVDQGGIDPSLFFDDDGNVHYTGTHWVDGEEQGIDMFVIDPITGVRKSEKKVIWNGTGGMAPEGPHIYHINGLYYLMIAEGGTEYGHRITIARSENIWGPYTPDPKNPILTHHRLEAQGCTVQATGHGDLIQTQNGDWAVVFLAYRLSDRFFHHLGRETFLAPVHWEDGWPVINNGLPIMLPEEQRHSGCITDRFRKKDPDFCWNTLRNPIEANYSIGINGLTLTGADTLDADKQPTMLMRRQEQFDMRTRTRLRLVSGSEEGCAGISIYYNAEHHFDLCLTRDKVLFRKTVGDIHVTCFEKSWNGDCVFEIRADRHRYEFLFGAPESNLQVAGSGLTRHVSTETTPISFTGVYIGLFAEGDCHAEFARFEYED